MMKRRQRRRRQQREWKHANKKTTTIQRPLPTNLTCFLRHTNPNTHTHTHTHNTHTHTLYDLLPTSKSNSPQLCLRFRPPLSIYLSIQAQLHFKARNMNQEEFIKVQRPTLHGNKSDVAAFTARHLRRQQRLYSLTLHFNATGRGEKE